jgi:hypothetical protein
MSDNSNVFLYQDGEGKQRHGDPTALLRRLHCYSHGDYNELLEECEAKEPETAFAANERLARAVCQTFHLGKPWNEETGEGVLEGRWREVLSAFLDHPEVSPPSGEAAPTVEGERSETQSHRVEAD